MLRHSGGTGPFSFKKKQGPPPCGRNRDGCFMKPQVVPPDDSRKRLLGKHADAPSASPSRKEGHGTGYLKLINRAGPSRSLSATVMSHSLRWRRRRKRESAQGTPARLSTSRKPAGGGCLNSTPDTC